MLFKKGDIVVGNEGAEKYGITSDGTYWKVTKDCKAGEDLTLDGNDNEDKGPWYVNPKNFDLVKPVGHTFKPGDKVKLNPMCKVGYKYLNITLCPEMVFSGARTIKEVHGDRSITLQEDSNWWYSDDMFIPATPEVTRPKTPIIIDGEEYEIIDKVADIVTLRKHSDISVGDKVEVVNNGATYSTASLNMLKNITDNEEYLVRYAYGSSPEKGFTGKVLAKGCHCSFDDREIFLIGYESYGRLFLMGAYGIKKV